MRLKIDVALAQQKWRRCWSTRPAGSRPWPTPTWSGSSHSVWRSARWYARGVIPCTAPKLRVKWLWSAKPAAAAAEGGRVVVGVDGSKPSLKAVQLLIDHCDWYRQPPEVELLAVHLPVPQASRSGKHGVEGLLPMYRLGPLPTSRV